MEGDACPPRKLLSALCTDLQACTDEAKSSSMEEQRPSMHSITHWLSPSTALAGSCRPQDPVFPTEYSCLHIFPSLVRLWYLIVTQLTWLQAGQAPFPSRMHEGTWCTSQTQTCLCISVCAQGAFSILYLLQAASTEGHGHRPDMVASISPMHRQKQSDRPSYQKENLPFAV